MRNLIYLTLCAVALCGCHDNDSPYVEVSASSGEEMSISCSIDQIYMSRVNDNGFANGDAIGIYITDYNGNTAMLASTGNHADNIKYTYDSETDTWSGSTSLYWTDSKTAVDAYSYYPYVKQIDDVRAVPFSVQHRQDKDMLDGSMSAYEASDFLWAKDEHVSPMTPIRLNHKHIMACAQISLVEGEGFDTGEWARLDKSVSFTNIVLDGSIDLRTGTAKVDSECRASTVLPSRHGNDWRCIIMPQVVADVNPIVHISVGDNIYELVREDDTEYMSGKMHKISIRVDKAQKGDYIFTVMSESIVAWENDDTSHNAEARAYITVHVDKTGNLKDAVDAMHIGYADIINLKITGELCNEDFEFLRENLTNLEAINLKEVKLFILAFYPETNEIVEEEDALPDLAFWTMSSLKYVVLPDNLKKIMMGAFQNTSIIGSVNLPEGLTYIGQVAFAINNVDGGHISRLILPTTLEYIGSSAFAGRKIYDDIMLPESLRYIGAGAFANNTGLTGTVHLPSQIKEIGNKLFYNTRVEGDLILPDGIESVGIGAFRETNINSLTLNDGLYEIGYLAFADTQISGDLVIPSSLKLMGEAVFSNTKINHVYFKNNPEEICRNLFRSCHELMDTLRIPESVNRIESGAFAYCDKLSAVILPERLDYIGSEAFLECYGLTYIQCMSQEPPVLGDNVFDGVSKDNFTLVVPKGCVDAYRNAEGWCEFKRISEHRDFVCRPQSARLLNRGDKRDLILNSEGDWSVTHIPAWMHIDKSSGRLKSELCVSIDDLPKGSDMRADSIVFALSGTDITTSYKVEQYDYGRSEDECVVLQQATKGRGINLVFVGDGYAASDIADGSYIADMRQGMEYFFDVEPYKTYREYFNVYTPIAMSYDSGIGTINTIRDVKFSTFVGDGKTRMSCDFDKALYYCVDHTPVAESDIDRLTCVVIPNTTVYDGVTCMYSGSFGNGAAVALCPKSTGDYPYDARGLVQHEAGGHAFGKLVDEYIYHYAWLQTCKCQDGCEHDKGLIANHNKGWGRNISLTGKYGEVEWKHLINDNRYNDIVDIYEGGYFHSRGAFRSERNSCMNDNVPYYSTWSRELIVQRIMALAGENYSFEKFVANDSRKWGNITTSSRAPIIYPQPSHQPRHGNAPIVVDRAPRRISK